jgi:cobalamin biosynthesis protein CobD/CbiB
VAAHAKDALGGPGISQIFDLPLTISAPEASSAEGLISGQDGQVFNFISTRATAVCAVVANQGAVAKEEQIRIGVEKRAARIAAEAVEMPSIASWITMVRIIDELNTKREGTGRHRDRRHNCITRQQVFK